MDDHEFKIQYESLAKLEPSLLLKGDVSLLIDEWQIAPNLWDTIRFEVDRGEVVQFILTASSLLSKLNPSSHSGTLRFARIKMRPMSLYESNDSNGSVSLIDLFNEKDI